MHPSICLLLTRACGHIPHRCRPSGLALVGLFAIAALTPACGPDDSGPKDLSSEQLRDAQQCKKCHPAHYQQWEGSMHAYAADDPLFLAMNARGQEETNGELGSFCVQCHAPVAVQLGVTTDGLNLADVPQALKGVTCFFCHSAAAVEGTHNKPIRLADDGVLRAAITDPVESPAHHAGYSPLLDRDERASADMCGSCHDIVTPAGVHLERSYDEWQHTLFANQDTQLTCANCHMPGRTGPAADFEGVGMREVHNHSMPAVDIALSAWPLREQQHAAVLDELNSSLVAQLCVTPPDSELTVVTKLENAFAGHSFPSGAAHDRRVWLELRAFVGKNEVFSSGVVGPNQALAELNDPQLWLLRDHALDGAGNDAHMFWDVRSVESNLLPQASSPQEPHFVSHGYTLPLTDGVPDRVEMKVWMRPMGREVLNDLVSSGHLTEADFADMPTHVVVDTLSWQFSDAGYGCVPPGIF